MASSLRKALGAVKDQTSIRLAKVASTNAPDLDVAIVKATSHDDTSVDEKYVLQILQLTSMSRAYANACLVPLAKRLSKTHNWIVAVKVLALIHRLLRDGNAFFKDEFSAESRRILNLSNFSDESHSNAWDYSTFVRTYAAYLDARMGCFVFDGEARNNRSTKDENCMSEYDHERSYNRSRFCDDGHDDDGSAPKQKDNISVKDMEPRLLLDRIPGLQQILERVLACRPTGAAKHHRIIHIAMYALVKESFQIYQALSDGISTLLDAYLNLKPEDCEKILEVYVRHGTQSDALSSFYDATKDIGVCRVSEYPTVNKISEDVLDNLEKHLRNRSPSPSRLKRPKATEAPRQSKTNRNPKKTELVAEQKVDADNDSYESMYGMRALPAPPTDQPPNNPSQIANSQSSITVKGLSNTNQISDLLNLKKDAYSAEEEQNKLALALFSTASSTPPSSNWETFDTEDEQEASKKVTTWQASLDTAGASESSKAGWELALVSEASNFTKVESSLAGNFDKLLLDSMYDNQGNKVSAPSGSASSAALPAKPSSAYLALPAPVATGGGDPFAASTIVPQPSYVQMTDLKQKQLLLLQEQQLWQQYQINGMQGHMNFYTAPYAATAFAPQHAFGLGMGASAQGR